MNKYKFIVISSIFSFIVFACSCVRPVIGTSTTNSGISDKSISITQNITIASISSSSKPISVQDAEAFFNLESVVFIDLRNKANYDTGHIQGSLLIPLKELEERLNEIPAGKKIIVYTGCQ
jgi:hypothetical protein